MYICNLNHNGGMRRPDIPLVKEKLDWKPKVKLEEGLTKTIEFFKSSLLILLVMYSLI